MCTAPSQVHVKRGPAWELQKVPCGKCWRCKANRVNDFVGRSLCEASVSDWVVTLTLTYRPRDDLADKVLTPRHFQAFIRSMRKTGHKVRYLAVGEYGTLRGRAHFHCILFGIGKKPEIAQKQSTNLEQWPHGFVFADWSADENAIRYVCKYLLKNEDKGSYWFTLSKKPALGSAFFEKKAAEAVRLGVFPSSFEYLPPGGHRNRPYLLRGAARRDYLVAIMEGMAEKGEVDRRRLSEWVAKTLEKEEYLAAVKKAEKWQKVHAKQAFEVFKTEIQERQARSRSADSYRLEVDRDIIGMSEGEHRHFLADVKEHLENGP